MNINEIREHASTVLDNYQTRVAFQSREQFIEFIEELNHFEYVTYSSTKHHVVFIGNVVEQEVGPLVILAQKYAGTITFPPQKAPPITSPTQAENPVQAENPTKAISKSRYRRYKIVNPQKLEFRPIFDNVPKNGTFSLNDFRAWSGSYNTKPVTLMALAGYLEHVGEFNSGQWRLLVAREEAIKKKCYPKNPRGPTGPQSEKLGDFRDEILAYINRPPTYPLYTFDTDELVSIGTDLGYNKTQVGDYLSELVANKTLVRLERGYYRLAARNPESVK